LASNDLGEQVLPEGWTAGVNANFALEYTDTDGRKQDQHPGKPEGLIAVANAIQDMRAISSVNLLKNRIGVDQAEALASILKEHSTLKSLCGNKGDETQLDMSGKRMDAGDAIMLVPEIVDNGALLVLSLKSNNLRADGGKALAEGLKSNQVITELNIADTNLASGHDMSGVIALADAIPGMGALLQFDISKNHLRAEGGGALAEALKGNQVMTELNVADNMLVWDADPHGPDDTDMSGIVAFADVIPGMGAMTSLDLSSNGIGSEGAVHVAEAIKVRN
jgi:Ran GTPase-activating protein (RanGAP) involved in mRNA processing and transport